MPDIDWRLYPNFSSDEFPEIPELYALDTTIASLQRARNALGVPIYPSPAPGALARLTGNTNSMHFADPRKKIYSRAVDFFCEGNPVHNFYSLLMSDAFRRIGVYFDKHLDGKPWVMFHGDNKSSSTSRLWFTDKRGVYHYPLFKFSQYAALSSLLIEHTETNYKR